MNKNVPLADFLEEAKRVIKKADEQKIVLRLMGAAAVRMHCPKHLHLHKLLGRELTDLDFMGYSKDFQKVKALFEELGYKQRKAGYALAVSVYGERFFFDDVVNNRVADVFFDKLRMCHTIDFKGRLEVDYPTIPLAELLLEKMQIVKINEKDIKDTIVLLREHDIGGGDKEMMNVEYIAKILSDDWGFYYTVTTNLNKVKHFLNHFTVLKEEDRKDVASKIDEILKMIEAKPKSLRWKMRAKIGTRKKWYEEVEESIRGSAT